MKQFLILFSFIAFYQPAYTQIQTDIELGGSNFMGFSDNLRYNIPLNKSATQFLVPRLGIGFSLPPWDGTSMSLNYGLSLKIKNFEVGADAATYFMDLLSSRNFHYMIDDGLLNGVIDPFIITYPNIKYTFVNKNRVFISAGIGVLVPFSYINYSKEWHVEDIIPFFNITTGYFYHKLSGKK
jgi:hypothetical protein